MAGPPPPTPGIDLPDAGFRERPPGRWGTDRVAGTLLVLLGAAVALEARSFRVAFLTDPLGPRALPFLVAALLAGSGVTLLVRPGPEPVWPGRRGLGRGAAGAAVFLLYALLMEPLGFALATVGAVAGLGILFGGPPRRCFLVGVVVTGALWVLFVPLLDIALPVGAVFGGGR